MTEALPILQLQIRHEQRHAQHKQHEGPLQIIEAKGLPRHRMLLHCRHQLGACLNSCLGGTEKAICGVRPARAYVTVNLGVARRSVPRRS